MPIRTKILPSWLVLAGLITGCGLEDPPKVPGILEWNRVELHAEAAEPIVEYFAAEGDSLDAGQKVLQLDARRAEAERDEAAAAQNEAAARLAELKRGPRSERIEEARARLRGAESALTTAENDFRRIETLVERKVSSFESLDGARTRRDQARAERDAATAALDELLTGATGEELQQAEAVLSRAQAHLRRVEITLNRLTVRAPSDGVLDVLPFEIGEQPRTGETVAVMLSGDTPYARVYVPEPIRARVKQGTPARILVDGVDEPFDGRVRMISREAAFTPYYSLTEKDRSRLSYVAEITVEGDRARELTPGIPVWIEFTDTDPDS